MAPVDLRSNSLKSATYQHQGAFLELEFRSGARYRYSGVPAQVYQDLLMAESKGGYFNLHIRERFIYAKIGFEDKRGVNRHSALNKDPE